MEIQFIYSAKHTIHDPVYEIYDGQKEPYAEKAERIKSIESSLKANGFKSFYTPKVFPLKYILAVHQKEYVSFLRARVLKILPEDILFSSYYIMDTYTPLVSRTYEAALTSVNVALTGAECILNGKKLIYSLCRPPGHHAEHNRMGGYCYFNNAAIAANYLSKKGKVAILDIDFHHGNGTQNIFYQRADVLYISLHANPHDRFPYNSGFAKEKGSGDGRGYNINFPLSLGTTDRQYLKILRKALAEIDNFNPKYLVVSAGFDTYEYDPIGGFKLTIPCFSMIGEEIRKIDLPTLVIQEGGYNVEKLGKIAVSFVRGLTGS